MQAAVSSALLLCTLQHCFPLLCTFPAATDVFSVRKAVMRNDICANTSHRRERFPSFFRSFSDKQTHREPRLGGIAEYCSFWHISRRVWPVTDCVLVSCVHRGEAVVGTLRVYFQNGFNTRKRRRCEWPFLAIKEKATRGLFFPIFLLINRLQCEWCEAHAAAV